jgi:hypothetical protein
VSDMFSSDEKKLIRRQICEIIRLVTKDFKIRNCNSMVVLHQIGSMEDS